MKRHFFTAHLTVRLFGLFVFVLLFFGLAQQLIYSSVLKNRLVSHYSSMMQRNAYMVSQNLYDLYVPQRSNYQEDSRLRISKENLAPFMAMVQQMTNCSVYIVDDHHNVTSYSDGVVQTISGHLFPGYIEQTIALGFIGKTPVVGNDTRRGLMLAACAPIMNEDSRVFGVILLTADAEELGYLQASTGSVIFVSFLLAFLLAELIAVELSWLFIRPLKRAKKFANSLSEGNYSIRLKNRRRDEIGSLINTMNELSIRLEHLREQEKCYQTQQQDFFSNISHELRTPVTIIRGSLEALHDGVLGIEKRETYYQRALMQIRSLDRLIHDMLELSRLRSLSFTLSMEEISLTEFVSDTAMSAAALCERKGVNLICKAPDREYHLIGDTSRLRQMLMTVIDNAVHFTEPGGSIRLLLEAGDPPVLLIADEGPGIPEEEVPKLFNRFHSTTQQSGEGTGLGLTIAQEIANRHGISIQVESRIGKGTTFRFLLEHAFFPKKDNNKQ